MKTRSSGRWARWAAAAVAAAWFAVGCGRDEKRKLVVDNPAVNPDDLPLQDKWTATSNRNAPLARGLHSAVWTGSKMIVWSGIGEGNEKVSTGGIYQ